MQTVKQVFNKLFGSSASPQVTATSQAKEPDRSIKERKGPGAESDYPRKNYEEEDLAVAAVRLVDDFTMTSYERLVTLWAQVRHVDRTAVPGALVECGTWKGGSSAMMALAHKHAGAPHREIHLFDSFEGLPEPDANVDGDYSIKYSGNLADGKMESIGRCVGPLEDNKKVMEAIVNYPKHLLKYHVGWFQETVPVSDIGEIAVLRLDGDWYESTRICLEHLYPQLVSGGILVIDDYGKWEGCRTAVDEYFAREAKPHYLHYIDPTGRYLIKP